MDEPLTPPDVSYDFYVGTPYLLASHSLPSPIRGSIATITLDSDVNMRGLTQGAGAQPGDGVPRIAEDGSLLGMVMRVDGSGETIIKPAAVLLWASLMHCDW